LTAWETENATLRGPVNKGNKHMVVICPSCDNEVEVEPGMAGRAVGTTVGSAVGGAGGGWIGSGIGIAMRGVAFSGTLPLAIGGIGTGNDRPYFGAVEDDQ
jgi:hypothetical protein